MDALLSPRLLSRVIGDAVDFVVSVWKRCPVLVWLYDKHSFGRSRHTLRHVVWTFMYGDGFFECT